MNIKRILFEILLLLSGSIVYSQCNISIASFYRNYAVTNCNGMIFQSVISAPSVYANGCDGFYSSPLTPGGITTLYSDAGPLRQVTVYPNPVVSTLNINWNKIDINCQVELFTTLGIKVGSFKHDKGERASQLYLSDLIAGFYFLTISNQAHQYLYSIKLLKF